MPKLLETAAQAGSFKTLLEAIASTDITDMLESAGPFTILAPTDEAFAALPKEELESLKGNNFKLKQVILYHVIYGDVRSDDLAQIQEAPTVEGSVVIVEQQDGIKVNGVAVNQMDVLTDNGVIHVLDGVLLPTILAPE